MKKLMGVQTQGGDVDQSPEKQRGKMNRTMIKLNLAPGRFEKQEKLIWNLRPLTEIKEMPRLMDERRVKADLQSVLDFTLPLRLPHVPIPVSVP
jgi:hypothetical protein